jgi:hypothetical protein
MARIIQQCIEIWRVFLKFGSNTDYRKSQKAHNFSTFLCNMTFWLYIYIYMYVYKVKL